MNHWSTENWAPAKGRRPTYQLNQFYAYVRQLWADFMIYYFVIDFVSMAILGYN